MIKLRNLIVCCVGFLLCMTCITDDNERTSLSEAIHVVDDNPQEAIALLEGIIPDPVNDKDQYMQYVVILTQARFMNDQNITTDSLILDAQRYFANTQNYEMAARSSYYAAVYWHEEGVSDKVVEYWQAAFSFAERADNNLFKIKSTYGLALSYFNQEQWEYAMDYCQKAYKLYDVKLDAGYYKLDVINMLGQIYREQQDYEHAYQFFNKGLVAAKNLNNIKYESRFLRQIGIIYRIKGDYRQAKENFDLALKRSESEDVLRTYLSYAKLYEEMNRPDSALHYLHLIEGSIPEITYLNTRRDMYNELATYYKLNEENVNKATHYLELAHIDDLCIKKSQSEKKAEAINQQLKQSEQKIKIQGQIYQRNFKYGIITLLLLVSLLVILEFTKRKQKKTFKNTIGRIMSNQVVDQQHFLLTCLRSIAKSTDDLVEKKLAYAGSSTWEQQLVLREEFISQIAQHTSAELERFHNGDKALSKLTEEDLSIIYMSGQKLHTIDYIGWLLGHQGNKEEYIKFRKVQIRQIMIDVGMRDRDVKMFLP